MTIPYGLFEVIGLELEYAVVDAALEPRALVAPAFRAWAGRPTSEVVDGRVGFTNELAAHVLELRHPVPDRSLRRIETALAGAARRFTRFLQERFDARLLPSGMHPWMHPRDASLWTRAGSRVYQAYAKLFPIRQHGWLNVQSCHVNLPFGRTEAETVALHNAVATLLPYLPAVAASSPLVEGRLGPVVDNRLAFYRVNQQRFPRITGSIVPEIVTSLAQYRREILAPIYRDLRRSANGRRLCHEWVNSRGAVLRWRRRALEIRVLDTQECVRMDVAVAAFVRGALRALLRAAPGVGALPAHPVLVADLHRVVRAGTRARVQAPHLRTRRACGETVPVRAVLEELLERAEGETPASERAYLDLVAERVRRGNLSERIARRVRAARGPGRRRDSIAAIYRELCACLEENEPWRG